MSPGKEELTVDYRRAVLFSKGGGLEHVQRRNGDALTPTVRLASILLVLPDVAGACIKQHRDEEEVHEASDNLDVFRLVVPPVLEQAFDAVDAADVEVLPSPVAGNLLEPVGSKVSLHNISVILSNWL